MIKNIIKTDTYKNIMNSSTYKNIMNSSTYKNIIKLMGCIVYRIRYIGLDCHMYLNKKLNNYFKHIKFYPNYFKYLTYFKQLFKKYCLISLDKKINIYYSLNNKELYSLNIYFIGAKNMEIAKKDLIDQIEKMLDNENNHVYKLALENILGVVNMYSSDDTMINSDSLLEDSLYYIENDCRSTSYYSSEVLQYEEDFDAICSSTYNNDYLQDIEDNTSLFKGVKEVLSDMYDYCLKVATYTLINKLFN